MPEAKENRPTSPMPTKRRGFNLAKWFEIFDRNAPGGEIRKGDITDGIANHHPGVNVRDLPSK